jgi:hypothetical protein
VKYLATPRLTTHSTGARIECFSSLITAAFIEYFMPRPVNSGVMLLRFGMKRIFIALVAFFIFVALGAHAQEQAISISHPFKVRLPQAVDTTNLSILYCLKGSFGGYYSFVRTKTGVHDYEIDTTYKGQPAESLKVIIYCPGYQVETLDFPSLAVLQERSVELQLKPLATVPFYGRVLLPAHLSSDEIKVDVNYSAFWECEFFGLMDCLVANFKMPSAELMEGGRFTVALPDFSHDPTVSSFSNRGDFKFMLSDRKSGRFLFDLKLKGSSDGRGRIPITESYPNEQIFIAIEER